MSPVVVIAGALCVASAVLVASYLAGGLSSEIVMTFAPETIRWGASVTAATLMILAAAMLWPEDVRCGEVERPRTAEKA